MALATALARPDAAPRGNRKSKDDVECTGERTREERDAKGRKNAVVLEEDEDE